MKALIPMEKIRISFFLVFCIFMVHPTTMFAQFPDICAFDSIGLQIPQAYFLIAQISELITGPPLLSLISSFGELTKTMAIQEFGY